MSTIVATITFLPVGAFAAFVCFLAFGVSPHAFLTFGGAVSGPTGLLGWWLAVLVPATVYAALCLRS
jgi:hypothetical protein